MDTEKTYGLGFNAGYLIAKYETMLAQKVVRSAQLGGNFLQGFSQGAEQLQLESNKESLRQLKGIRVKGNDLAHNFELD